MTSIFDEETIQDRVSHTSLPSDLRITDIRFAEIVGAPMHCTLIKVSTKSRNRGVWRSTGCGEQDLCCNVEK